MNSTHKNTLLALIVAATVMGCSDDQPGTASEQQAMPASHVGSGPCSNVAGLTTYCGYKNPEDIEPTPDRRHLIISEMGEFMTDAPGQLVLFDIESGAHQPMSVSFDKPAERWGDESCPAPETALFSPHGIDVSVRSDGRDQLLVVNHGGREAVEYFELQSGEDGWQANWQGCILPPGDPFINDAAGLADGSVLVTHMWDKSTPFDVVAEKLLGGEKVGWVWRWDPESGFRKLPGSDEQMPNGIAVSADDKFAFINIYMGNKTIKVDAVTGERLGEFAVRQPDNVTVDPDGTVWVASHQQDPINETCAGVEEGACLLPFRVVRADPESMEAQVFFDHKGEPMGYTTVATHVDGTLYMGSAHGDRIATMQVEAD